MSRTMQSLQKTAECYQAESDRKFFGTKYSGLDEIFLRQHEMQLWRKVMRDCGRDIRNVHSIGELRFIEDFVYEEIGHLRDIGIQRAQVEELKKCYCISSGRNFPVVRTSLYRAIA